jgi:nucleoside-diphosphate-sugar epimerase
MNNILVTGGQGFIGQHLVMSLIDLGYSVTVVDYDASVPCHANFFYPQDCSLFFEQRMIQFDTANLRDILGDPVKYDLVIHLAAIPRVGISLNAPARVIKNNVNSTIFAAEYCRKAGIPLINISSSSVVWADCDKNPYALSKKMGEQIINTYRETFNVKATNVRLFNVYGPGEKDNGNYTTLIRRCKTALRTKTPLPLFGTGENRRDYTHVLDVVQGIILVMRDVQQNTFKPVYELGSGTGHISVNDIIKEFSEAGLTVDPQPARPGDPPLTKADTTLWPEGWAPKIDVLTHIRNWIHMGCQHD